jgi:RNA polymerase sigma-70 factor (ECF subfamily)
MSDRELERLYEQHANACFAFALNLTRSEADARDALQDVFSKLARHRNSWEGIRDERAYLLRLTHHAAVDQIRRREVRRRAEDVLTAQSTDLFAATADPDEAAFRTELAGALAELPPDQRAVVHLKLWEGLTFDRIADTLEIPLNTAASRYRYGLDKLRARLRPLYEELQ